MSDLKISVPTRILIFEPEHAGHQMEYLMLFIKRAIQEKKIHMSLIMTEELLDKLQRNSIWQEAEKQKTVEYKLLSKTETSHCNHHFLPLRSIWLWHTLRHYLAMTKATHVLSMRVDHYQLAMALRLPLTASLIGILFQPSLHYATLKMTTMPLSIREYIKNMRQRVLYTGMLSNPAMHTLFTLDDTFSWWGKTHLAGAQKIRYLPDPAHPEIIEYADTPITKQLPKGRIIFLIFGALARRKGIFTLFTALSLLSISERQQLCIVFAGQIVADERQAFQEQLACLQAEDADGCLHIDGFLSIEDMTTLLRHCNIVLACYQRFVGSSGIILWAASAGKPVLAQSYGQVGKWTADHQLGVSVDTCNAYALSKSLLKLCDEEVRQHCFDGTKVKDFAAAHHPDIFAKRLISSITGEQHS